jgi:translation initiation factor 2B subunit (eIF-2B alpha/beta/delta family)
MDNSVLQQLFLMSEAIDRQQAVAVLGAGVSSSGSTKGRGREMTLPSGNELVKRWAMSRNYIKEGQSLAEAAFAIKQREGRTGLLKLIEETIGMNIPPLPAHHALGKLPFVAYISFNFDELLEKALEHAGRTPHRIIKDSNVSIPSWGSVPVIKPHGTISQPDTIRIASDEIIDLTLDAPLTVDLIKITIAQRRLLYVGFSLSDPDFIALHYNVVRRLESFAPVATAVVLKASEHERSYWREQGVTIVEMDLSQFLEQLSAIKTVGDDIEMSSIQIIQNDPWLQDPFFQKLLSIRSLPSETQVIEALLEQVEEEAQTANPNELTERLKKARTDVLRYRPNYAAFGKVGNAVIEMMSCAQNKGEFQQSLSIYRTQRRHLVESLSFATAGWIKENDKIYLYSQSKRVIEGIRTVIPAIQETCTIYISECRPKSPTSFQDAYAIYDALKDTHYRVRLIPDAAFAHLIDTGEITKVLMGAHQLCEIQGKVEYFVNTCGSLAITRVCDWYRIPLIVVAEKDKIEEFTSKDKLNGISRSPEENLTKVVVSELLKIRSVASGVKIDNYGYDVCPVTSNVILVINKD